MKKVILIIFISAFINCNQNNQNNSTKQNDIKNIEISKEELDKRKTQFYKTQKNIISILKKNKNLKSIKFFLSKDFSYRNYFIRDKSNEGSYYGKHYQNDDENLKEINDKINIDALLRVLREGKIIISDKSAFIRSSKKEKDPMIDWWYYPESKKWKVTMIQVLPAFD